MASLRKTLRLVMVSGDPQGQRYGVGSYLKAFFLALRAYPSVEVWHVLLNSSQHTEACMAYQSGRWEVYVPPIVTPVQIKTETTAAPKAPARELNWRGLALLLQSVWKTELPVLFQLNLPVGELARELKTTFQAPVVYMNHLQFWITGFGGDLEKLRISLANRDQSVREHPEWKTIFELMDQERQTTQLADCVVYLSDEARDYMAEFYSMALTKMLHIPNGLAENRQLLQYKRQRRSIRRQLGFASSDVLILSVGRIHPDKGLVPLIEAFREVLRTGRRCRLIIAGDGDYDACLKASKDIWSHITYTGYLNAGQLAQLYAIADIGVVPSLNEEWSYKALEMMANGLPIVATNTGGLKKLFGSPDMARVVPVQSMQDTESLTKGFVQELMKLIDSPELRTRLGENARQRWHTQFQATHMVEQAMKLYSKLLQPLLEANS